MTRKHTSPLSALAFAAVLFGFGSCARLAFGQVQLAGEFPCTLQTPKSIAICRGKLLMTDAQAGRIIARDGSGACFSLAGGGTGGDGGLATSAKLSNPIGLACGNDGVTVYVVDQSTVPAGSARIRKIDAAGYITTFATVPASITGAYGWGLSANADGSFLWALFNVHVILRVSPAGVSQIIAGTQWYSGWLGDGGAATSAKLNSPTNAVTDPITGDILISDFNNRRLRRIRAGIISTVAGDGYAVSDGDGGPPSGARLNQPMAVAADSEGTFYVGEMSPTGSIRRIKANLISTAWNLGAPVYGLYAGAGSLYASSGTFVYGGMPAGGPAPTVPPATATAIPATPTPTIATPPTDTPTIVVPTATLVPSTPTKTPTLVLPTPSRLPTCAKPQAPCEWTP